MGFAGFRWISGFYFGTKVVDTCFLIKKPVFWTAVTSIEAISTRPIILKVNDDMAM